VCGDGYVDTARGERCDDGNTNNHDGCDPTCRYTGTIGAVAGFFGANGGAYCDENGIYARFKLPSGVAVSGTSVFVADTLSHTIRRLDTTSGAVTLFAGRPFISGSADGAAGQATFNQPVGVATDGTYVYVADAGNQLVRRVQISDGSTLTIAGAAGVAGSADGVGTSARFNGPVGVAYYNNSLFVADLWNCTIRQISTSGFGVTTYAGTAGECGYSDVWPGRFNHPWGLAVGPDGLYVADTDNSVIRRIYSQFNPSPWPGHIDWFVTTPYGTAGVPGHADGNGASATFDHPHTLTAAGNTLFAADTNNHTIRALDTTGSRVVTTLAGSPGVGQWGDGTGAVARFKLPYGIAASGTDLFVSEWNNYDLRRVAQAGGGTVTLAGHAPMAGSYDGTTAEFRQPGGLSIEANGKLLVGDVGNCTLREVTLGSPASVATLAGVAGTCNVVDGVGSAAHFKTAQWPLVAGPLAYVADGWDIRSVTLPGAAVTRIAGSASGAGSADNATGLSATFTTAQSVAADASYLYVADQCAIRRVALASPNEVKTIIGVVGSAGAADGAGSAARLCGSTALPFVSLLVVGTTLYVSDTSNFTVRAVDLSNPNGPYSIHTLAGYVGSPGWMDGTGASARFTWPVGLAYDGQSLFVADRELIRQIADLDAMSVTTLTGRSGCQSAVPGDYQHAALNTATGLAYSPQTGYLYVADYAENLVREIR
jgi:cysteine-rich repeat protein